MDGSHTLCILLLYTYIRLNRDPPPPQTLTIPRSRDPNLHHLKTLKEDCTVNYGLRHSFLSRPRGMTEENKMT